MVPAQLQFIPRIYGIAEVGRDLETRNSNPVDAVFWECGVGKGPQSPGSDPDPSPSRSDLGANPKSCRSLGWGWISGPSPPKPFQGETIPGGISLPELFPMMFSRRNLSLSSSLTPRRRFLGKSQIPRNFPLEFGPGCGTKGGSVGYWGQFPPGKISSPSQGRGAVPIPGGVGIPLQDFGGMLDPWAPRAFPGSAIPWF